MQYLKEDRVLKYRPNTLKAVREEVNLDKPGRIDESLDILEDWVKKQPHFVKKDLPRDYLERALILKKGFIERTKEMIDKLCTFKTLMPEFYTISSKTEFEAIEKILFSSHLPQLTPEHSRIYLVKFNSDNISSALVFSYFKYLILLCEYMARVEYASNYIIILDYRQLKSVMNFLTKVNVIELRQIITLITEGYGCRIKAIHVVSESKMVESLIIMLKQVFSSKLIGRIHTHKNFETIYDYVPKDILPEDFGGKEKSLKDCHNDWLEALTSKEFVEYFKEMTKASTDESCRRVDKFTELYAAMPGSFRALSVD